MELSGLVAHLSTSFQNPLFELPGIQRNLSPIGREKWMKENKIEYRLSAVLLLLFPDDQGNAQIALVRRAVYDGPHSGQIAIPGGRFEDEDQNVFRTAIRETHEELGYELPTEQLLGRLTTLQVPVSRFEIAPIIGYSNSTPTFTIDKTEVDELIQVPIQTLIDAPILETSFKSSGNFSVKAPYYQLNDLKVWGATAMILAEFLELLKKKLM